MTLQARNEGISRNMSNTEGKMLSNSQILIYVLLKTRPIMFYDKADEQRNGKTQEAKPVLIITFFFILMFGLARLIMALLLIV